MTSLFSTRLRWVPVFVLMSTVLALSAACTPVGVMVGGAATAGAAALEERGIRQATIDLETKGKIVHEWFQHDASWAADLSATVYEDRAMLTGTLPSDTDRATAVGLAWTVPGVTEVINEIEVLEDTSLLDTANDTWIATQLQTQMTFDENIMAINYKTKVVNATIYHIGTAQNQAELDRVIQRSKAIKSVRRVVTHVNIKPQTQGNAP